ncbi:hypothetical protein G8O24_13385 [Bradyrhizobium sp. INPA01-394B]|uniref:AlgX/AlgJ SGNH hydrolase-like domain-containing protein n=1 Tax=Bradyrhizobium campsiandrae TaxID=1729892 RepID=A0ABR7UEX4_9BRAD|nr:hypothetical protein [Bradyrhizobium campsiandrae]MBC9878335.1 hypothetical protein [Bradyrhizobium campsiandrae]MBC9982417.1 hypothetical protein [Bradyrhizobium campsiandrae]
MIVRTLIVVAVIFAGLAAVLTRGREAIGEILATTSMNDLVNGHFAERIDKAIFKAVPRSATLDGAVAGLQYRLLHDAGRQVHAGCGNWLYAMEELGADKSDARNMKMRAEVLHRLVRLIKQLGAVLVVIPIPDKAEQVEDQLCGLTATQSRRRDVFRKELSQTDGVIVVDVKPDWPRPGYWHLDTHWDQSGARFAANRTAQAITAAIGAGQDQVRLSEGAWRDRTGDLVRLAGLTDAPAALAPAPEQERDVKADIQHSGGLLDDTAEPSVILAGSSFSLNSAFADYLQAALSREVAQASEAGGGFAGALLGLLEKNPASLANAKVIIWEWPMRSLTTPLSPLEQRFLAGSRGQAAE